jgi:hypothetical protein
MPHTTLSTSQVKNLPKHKGDKDSLAVQVRAERPLPTRERLSYEQDGAKYYPPVPLIVTEHSSEISYNLPEIQRIFKNISPVLHNYDPTYVDTINQKRLYLKDFYAIQPKIDPVSSQQVDILLNWIILQTNTMHQKICNEFHIKNPNELLADVQIAFRSPLSHNQLGGIFHQDVKNRDNDKFFQILIPLEADSMGTLFIPSHNKTFSEQVVSNIESSARIFKSSKKTGIVEQADPNQFFSMQKEPHTITHCIPAEIDPNKLAKLNPNNGETIKRPLLLIQFYTKKIK